VTKRQENHQDDLVYEVCKNLHFRFKSEAAPIHKSSSSIICSPVVRTHATQKNCSELQIVLRACSRTPPCCRVLNPLPPLS
jgi:hypothetical protein